MLVQYQRTKYSEEYTIILHPRASAQEVVATGVRLRLYASLV